MNSEKFVTLRDGRKLRIHSGLDALKLDLGITAIGLYLLIDLRLVSGETYTSEFLANLSPAADEDTADIEEALKRLAKLNFAEWVSNGGAT